jgi:hypothetical protein
LPTRTCPPGAYATTTRVNGRVAAVEQRREERALFVRTSVTSDLTKLVLGGASVLRGEDRRQIQLSDMQHGDRVSADAVPTPDKALVYLGRRIDDRDLRWVQEQVGFVTRRYVNRRLLAVQVAGKGREMVSIAPSTRFVGVPSSARLRGVHVGDTVVLRGVLNARLARVVRTVTIEVHHTSEEPTGRRL